MSVEREEEIMKVYHFHARFCLHLHKFWFQKMYMVHGCLLF